MSASIRVISAGPGVSLQDLGRPGGLGIGLSPGGAADRMALIRGHALVGNGLDAAAIEMAAMGGRFQAEGDIRAAITGAKMRATLNGAEIAPDASFDLRSGDILDIGAALEGVYGYLSVSGGFASELILGGRGYHGIAHLGTPVSEGDCLEVGAKSPPNTPCQLLATQPPNSTQIRIMEGPQTALFPAELRKRFETTTFTRSTRGNRQGVQLDLDGERFSTGSQLSLVSDFISVGDIQMAGDGTPYVLLADCQTMGGYPRIGTVLPSDLSRIAQAQPGTNLNFRFVSAVDAEKAWISDEKLLKELEKNLAPVLRDPREISDLLSYDLIGLPAPEVSGDFDPS